MEQVTRRTMLALAMPVALLALAGCGTTTATSAAGGDVNQADIEFVTQAYNLIRFDRAECSLAPTYTQTPAIREIAVKLLNDADAFDAKLRPIIKAQGITRPTELPSDLRARLYYIRLHRGLEFDRSFLWDQIFSHREALHRYEMLIGTPGQNPQLVALAKEGIEELRQNLAALRAIQRQLPPPTTAMGPFGLPPLPHFE